MKSQFVAVSLMGLAAVVGCNTDAGGPAAENTAGDSAAAAAVQTVSFDVTKMT